MRDNRAFRLHLVNDQFCKNVADWLCDQGAALIYFQCFTPFSISTFPGLRRWIGRKALSALCLHTVIDIDHWF